MSAIIFLVVLAMAGAWVILLLCKIRDLRRLRETLLREKDVAYSFVHDVGDVFVDSESVGLNTMLERVLFYAQKTTGALAGAVYLVDPDGRTLRAQAVSGTFPPIISGLPVKTESFQDRLPLVSKAVREQTVEFGEGIIGTVARDAASLLIRNAELDTRIPRFDLEYLTVHTMLLAPMRFHRQVLGVLVVINRVDEMPFTETDQNLLESLADQASVAVHYLRQSAALDEKRQIDRDLSLAREIQTALLPKQIPEINGVNIAAFSKAAQRIGGDYYDFIKVDDEHLGIVTADVSGKGISGAIVMSICRSIIRAHAPGNLSPASVLKAANAALTRDLAEDLFITVLYMLINSKTLELKIARAGHLAPLVFRGKSKELVPMESDGIAIGISDAAVFDEVLQERSLMLHRGDMVLAYTDGITEAMDQNGNEWAEDNLVDTAQETLRGGGKACDVARDVRRVLVDFVGGTAQQDDMTMVALQVD